MPARSWQGCVISCPSAKPSSRPWRLEKQRVGWRARSRMRHDSTAWRSASRPARNVDHYGSRVEQLLVNLIRNRIEAAAERTSGEGRVRVRIGRSNGGIRVDVEDNGPGVAPDMMWHLFEPFTTNKPRGMGLGLLLSRQIAEAHGGSLELTNRPDERGCRVRVVLPRPVG